MKDRSITSCCAITSSIWLKLLDREERYERETDPLLPFEEDIVKLQEDRQKLRFVTADGAVTALAIIGERIKEARAATVKATPLAGQRASQQADRLRGALEQWFGFYNGYDPAFTQKVPPAYREVTQALSDYSRFLREKVAGLKPGTVLADNTGRGGGRGGRGRGGAPDNAPPASDEIVGDPIGREGLMEDLAGEMIVYTPEQLIEIGNREYAWCENEMKKASREMGYGDDWMKALEKVKNAYVPRGGQPELIRDLALEAEAYLKKHDLVTIPPLAADIWRMQMMTPERQRVNPFFTGGETISVSYPTDSMSPEEHLMSMRGNGIHVSRATVQHELIPGHHLKGFMSDRYNPHRALFNTPFMGEGWALYWELFLWDHGFPRSPEDRVGMLWWRMHRAARIIFSLNFHLGALDARAVHRFPGQSRRPRAVHRDRRSAPLLRRQLLAALSGRLHDGRPADPGAAPGARPARKMTVKAFHDTILREGSMPIEMLRAALAGQPLAREYRAQWKYTVTSPAAK